MGALVMSEKERRRLEVFGRVRDGQISLATAAALLGISERQGWRLKRRFASEADAGLVHRLRGRQSNRRTDDATRQAVLKLYRSKYAGWGPTLACEYLAKEDGHAISHDTLGRWLRAEGLFGPHRTRSKHRRLRPRRSHCGELVQMDGSWHDWLEGRGGWCCLMVLVDDASGRVFARFYEKETLEAAFDVLERYAAKHGLPRALYVDRAGIYRGEDAQGRATRTQFGRAMAELGVELILANSPQAKGRVERMNGTLQDRLAKEMSLRKIGSIQEANALLEAGPFLAELNARLTVKPAKSADLHRRMTPKMKLQEVLCVREERAAGRDWCVQWRGRLLQIDEKHAGLDLPRPGRRVTVIERLDGTLLLRYGKERLCWQEVSRRPAKQKAGRREPVTNNKRWKPGAAHPWKKERSCGNKPPVGGSTRPRPAARPPEATPPAPLRRDSQRVTVLLR